MSAAAFVVIRARAQRHKTYDFVKGLNNHQFGAIRTQILGMAPFPTLNEASYIAMSKAYNNIPNEAVFKQLKCTQDGLTSKEATRRLKIFGPNRLFGEEKKNKFLKLFGFINGNKRTNVGLKCMLLRDNKWKELNAVVLVPGDIIRIKFGDIVPADARLLQGDSIMVNQYVLTGESLPVTRGPGEEVFSGSTCTHGEIEAVVIATGVQTTFFGKAAHPVDSRNNAGHFRKE